MNLVLLKNKTTPSDPYEESFGHAGCATHFIPLLNHSHLDKAEIAAYLRLADFVSADAFIITSQRAVECFNECVAMVDAAERARILAKPGYTVGPATAEILARAGFGDIRGGLDAGNGLVLAEIIIRDLDAARHRVVFFTGEIRKDIIPRRLGLHGFALVERVLYRTEPRGDIVPNFERCCRHLELRASDRWLVFFSPQGTEPFIEYLRSHNGLGFKVASIGPTTEQFLRDRGVAPHVVARKPTPTALLHLIQHASEPAPLAET